MKITESVYKELISLKSVPPETGGIIGAKEDIIDTVFWDNSNCDGVYVPNIEIINKVIAQWANDGISFCGMFHTHAPQWPNLSKEDENYIREIMSAMPESIERLYFPLVFPKERIKAYAALKKGQLIYIKEEKLGILQKKEFFKWKRKKKR